MNKFFQEKVIVVVGASSGIGRVTAKMLADRHAEVILVGRSEESLLPVQNEIKNSGGRAEFLTADVTVFEDLQKVADWVATRHGRIDAWIHNAGSTEFSYFWEMEPEEISRMVQVNLTGNLFGARAALPHLMRNPGSSLIHITTVEAIHGTPYLSVYSAAKSGVSSYLEVLRMELEEKKVDVHLAEILPAGTDTPFFHNALTRLGVLPAPMGKIYNPEVVAQAILRSMVHRKKRIVVGFGGKMMFFFHKICPPLIRWGIRSMTFKGQKTDIPKRPSDPHNLFHPQPAQAKERGGWPLKKA